MTFNHASGGRYTELISDEKLFYVVVLHIPFEALDIPISGASEPPSELLRYLSRLQVSLELLWSWDVADGSYRCRYRSYPP